MERKQLALYDFASKQQYIYRTSKIKEISGASMLLAQMYDKFVEIAGLKKDLTKPFSLGAFERSNVCGEVLYEGGGNLMVLYRSEEDYRAANRLLSVYLLKNAPGLTMIATCVPFSGNFSEDKKKLYTKNALRKNLYPSYELSAVTPMTQIDPMTFSAVVKKERYPEEASYSADRVAKRMAYSHSKDDNLDDLDGLTAVIYIDGNAMGDKLKRCDHADYNEGVKRLRAFSASVNESFVTKPLAAIREAVNGGGFRRVIGGGDEITILCKAELAWKIVCTYFDALKSCTVELPDGEVSCTSCAGIALFHAKAPFDVAYGIAEAACENAKKRSHLNGNCNCVDFYYCHAGITNTFEYLRSSEQAHATGRPYLFDEAKEKFEQYTPLLNAAGRANVKALGSAAQISKAKYRFEVQRVNAYLPTNGGKFRTDDNEEEMKLVYDMSEFYDVWFAKDEGGAADA